MQSKAEIQVVTSVRFDSAEEAALVESGIGHVLHGDKLEPAQREALSQLGGALDDARNEGHRLYQSAYAAGVVSEPR